MEEKSCTYALKRSMAEPTGWSVLFASTYLAVLPMSNTMALRNVAVTGLLISLMWQFSKMWGVIKISLPVLLWAAYLFLFPFISGDTIVAWDSFSSQWGRGLLAMLVGAGVAAIVIDRERGVVFYLGAISSVPVLIHLVLFALNAWQTNSVPLGFWGRETHHADLGYAAGHTVILMAVTIVAADRKYRFWAVAFILAALLSTVLAESRAGFAFAALGGLCVFLLAHFNQFSKKIRHVGIFGLVTLLVAVVILAFFAIKEDPRWRSMAQEHSAGWMGNAIQIECEGTASVEQEIISKYGGDNSQSVINSVRGGDASRVVVLRAGIELAAKYPWGSDGSRQGFQKRLMQVCPNPAISMAHTHNGWVDTLLAIGWLGAVLYLAVLLQYFRLGLSGLRDGQMLSPWALALTVLSIFWITRGLTDSVFRDHMLQMQGFVLAFFATAWRLQRHQKTSFSHPTQPTPQSPTYP